MNRHNFSVGTIAFAAGAALVSASFALSKQITWADVGLNFGVEIFGIAITVLIVDQVLESRKNSEERQRIARRALHELDHAVWVWQGGSRSYYADELLFLCTSITEADPVPEFLQNILIRMGSQAANTIRIQCEVIKGRSGLKEALEVLANLESIRDGKLMPVLQIREVLLESSRRLIIYLNDPISAVDDLQLSVARDPSISAQRLRHFGVPPPEAAKP